MISLKQLKTARRYVQSAHDLLGTSRAHLHAREELEQALALLCPLEAELESGLRQLHEELEDLFPEED